MRSNRIVAGSAIGYLKVHPLPTCPFTISPMPTSPDDSFDSPRTSEPGGLRKGLTSYGDHDFSLFLRKASSGAGYTDSALDRQSSRRRYRQRLQPCHGNAPAGRGGQARRDAGRWTPMAFPDDFDPREPRRRPACICAT